jgi:hypothetical protein
MIRLRNVRGSRVRLALAAFCLVVLLGSFISFDRVGADCGDSPVGWVCNTRANVLLDAELVAVTGLFLVLAWELASRWRRRSSSPPAAGRSGRSRP